MSTDPGALAGVGLPRVTTAPVMGTVASVHVYGAVDPVIEAEAVRACLAELRDADRIFSTYRDDSAVCRIARGELALADAPEVVREVHDRGVAWVARTGGRFSTAWRGDADPTAPRWDPTGIVKGWAADRAHARLRPLLAAGASAVGLGVGGDLVVATAPASDHEWRIGIADPHRPGAVLATLLLRDGAVATSGTAERGAHIIDPRTGAPASGRVASATVVAEDLESADVLATAAVVAGWDDLGWVADAGTRSGMLVGDDGRVRRWVGPAEVVVGALRDADALSPRRAA